MTTGELIILAIGLSMDAFAVSISLGLTRSRLRWTHYLSVSALFGLFQALLPLVGYVLTAALFHSCFSFGYIIAFFVLAGIGGNMIWHALRPVEEGCPASPKAFRFCNLLLLSLAVSIDAMAAGASFAFIEIHVLPAVVLIGVVTALFSLAGLKIGNLFGSRYEKWAELAGGIVLILIGFRILIENTPGFL